MFINQPRLVIHHQHTSIHTLVTASITTVQMCLFLDHTPIFPLILSLFLSSFITPLPSSLSTRLSCALSYLLLPFIIFHFPQTSPFRPYVILFIPLISPPFSSSLPILLFPARLPLCLYRSVGSLRPSYILGMPATDGPHSSSSAREARYFFFSLFSPNAGQPKAERATALLHPKII